MIYTIKVELNQFQDNQLKAKAALREKSVDEVLTALVQAKVNEQADAYVEDALKTKLSKMSAGLALAKLNAMDE